jgi:chromosomal replication initiation ATPase DnaA
MAPDAEGPRRLPSSRQLALDLARPPAMEPEDFLVSPSNAEAFALMDLWPDWPASTLVVVGPPGSGKSHLASIWARRARARIVVLGEAIDPIALAAGPALVLEDCDRALHSEAALFHLLNLMTEAGGWLVVTARAAPNSWGLGTADLLSRLRLAPTVAIGSPDAALLRAVMVKLFMDRQIRIEAEVVTYATRRLEQTLEAVSRFVQAVDDAALASGRRITKPLAAAVIEALRPLEG